MIFRQIPLDLNEEISVDLFAGGGGASSGYERATGRHIDVAVNHDPAAVSMHRVNHPQTKHHTCDVFEVDPREVTQGRPVGLLWASPDCTFHSKARGAKPIRTKEKKRRALAWVVTRWAGQARPRVIMLENVEEFADWGPLVGPPDKLVPCRRRRGRTFRRWVRSLEAFGYRVEWRELRACDYGAPTIRKRLFLIARCDGQPVVWPHPTHGPGRPLPYRTAAECIDWTIPMLSIFATKAEARAWGKSHGQNAPIRPLAEATQRRIARGVMRYVVNNPKPFIVGVGGRQGQSGERPLSAPMQTITSKGDSALVAPYLVPRYGERPGQEPRVRSLEEPAPVIVPTGNGGSLAAVHIQRDFGNSVGHSADGPLGVVTPGGGGKAALVASFMAQHNTGMVGHHLTNPVSTIVNKGCTQALLTANLTHQYSSNTNGGAGEPEYPLKTQTTGNHAGLVYSFLQKYYGQGIGQELSEPAPTVTTKDRIGLVTVEVAGEPYILSDIAMRMLQPRELYSAQGFDPWYVIDHGMDDRGRRVTLTKTEQVRMCGNSVSPDVSAAIIGANLPEMIGWDQAPRLKKSRVRQLMEVA